MKRRLIMFVTVIVALCVFYLVNRHVRIMRLVDELIMAERVDIVEIPSDPWSRLCYFQMKLEDYGYFKRYGLNSLSTNIDWHAFSSNITSVIPSRYYSPSIGVDTDQMIYINPRYIDELIRIAKTYNVEIIEMKANKRVQRTLHKVSGPLTRDVGAIYLKWYTNA